MRKGLPKLEGYWRTLNDGMFRGGDGASMASWVVRASGWSDNVNVSSAQGIGPSDEARGRCEVSPKAVLRAYPRGIPSLRADKIASLLRQRTLACLRIHHVLLNIHLSD